MSTRIASYRRFGSQAFGRESRLQEHAVGVHGGEVAGEDRDRHAEVGRVASRGPATVLLGESRVRRRHPATHGGFVHDVVVDDRERVKQLRAAARMMRRSSPPPAAR